MSSLRPYQQQVVADVRAALASAGRSGVIMMPTGAGKTKTTVHGLCRPWLQASTANRLYWLVERKALVGQAAADLEQAGARVGLLWAGASPLTGHENALVASVQTLEARPDMRAMFEASLTDRRTLVVADEVHAPDSVPAGYRWDGGIWAASFKRVGDLLLYDGQAAEVVWCAAPDGEDTNHTIKVKVADEEEHEINETEVVWTLERVGATAPRK